MKLHRLFYFHKIRFWGFLKNRQNGKHAEGTAAGVSFCLPGVQRVLSASGTRLAPTEITTRKKFQTPCWHLRCQRADKLPAGTEANLSLSGTGKKGNRWLWKKWWIKNRRKHIYAERQCNRWGQRQLELRYVWECDMIWATNRIWGDRIVRTYENKDELKNEIN